MTEVLEFALGVAVGVVAYAVGRVHGRRSRSESPERPVCGCGHHRAYHDADTGECHATRRQETYRESDGWPTGAQDVRCTCRRYVGPEPVSSLWAPPVSTEDE